MAGNLTSFSFFFCMSESSRGSVFQFLRNLHAVFHRGGETFYTAEAVPRAPFPCGAVLLAIRATQQLFIDLKATSYLPCRNFYIVFYPVFNQVLSIFTAEL